MRHGKILNSKQLQKTNLAIDNSLNHQGVVFLYLNLISVLHLLLQDSIACISHKNIKTTTVIYTHITNDMKQTLINSLDTISLNRK